MELKIIKSKLTDLKDSEYTFKVKGVLNGTPFKIKEVITYDKITRNIANKKLVVEMYGIKETEVGTYPRNWVYLLKALKGMHSFNKMLNK